MADQDDNLREIVANVAAAYFSNSHVSPTDIPSVISQIANSLNAVGASDNQPAPAAEEPTPQQQKLSRAQINKSIRPEALISFEDGKPYKTLRRHLAVRSLNPEQYREKWGLPRDYPMVAPNYSEQRKALAQQIGLGRKRGPAAAAPPAPAPAPAPKKVGRPRKATAAANGAE